MCALRITCRDATQSASVTAKRVHLTLIQQQQTEKSGKPIEEESEKTNSFFKQGNRRSREIQHKSQSRHDETETKQTGTTTPPKKAGFRIASFLNY